MLFLTVIILLIILIYKKAIKPTYIWKEKGIPYLPAWPFVGNFGPSIFRRMSFVENIEKVYKQMGDARYMGMFTMTNPGIFIKDLDLIKTITVKEFDSFADHRASYAFESDPLLGKSLFNMKREIGWQDMRATLSPTFTSSKMKAMFSLMENCTQEYANYYLKQDELVEIDVKDSLTRVANDVIASTAFGVTCNSLENKENEFYINGRTLTNFTGIKNLLFFIMDAFPTISKMLNLRLFDRKASNFFIKAVKDSITFRKQQKIVRPDVINILMEAKKNREEEEIEATETGFATVEESNLGKAKIRAQLLDDDIAAQAIIFFFAGFETISTSLSHALYDLCVNPQVQEKLYNEIMETLEKNNGKINYDAVMKMKYLDCVISESLRIRPGAIMTDRKCLRSFTIEPKSPDEKPLYVEKGMICVIPVWAIQRDPNNYPNPEKYDPERFNDENKHNIHQFSYLPFGAGPRNCIGSRFALLEMKLIVLKLIQFFEIVPTAKTCIPLKFGVKNFNGLPDDGLWLGLKRR